MWYNVDQTESWGVGAMAGIEFAGNFAHTIDPKGRVTIPAAFREALADGFTIGLNNQFAAIALYPKAKWNEKCEQLAKIPESDIMGTRYVRLITGNSFSGCELDNQGRVLLPATLRAKVGMDKAIRFVGMGGYLESGTSSAICASPTCPSSRSTICSIMSMGNIITRRYNGVLAGREDEYT